MTRCAIKWVGQPANLATWTAENNEMSPDEQARQGLMSPVTQASKEQLSKIKARGSLKWFVNYQTAFDRERCVIRLLGSNMLVTSPSTPSTFWR